MRQPKQVLFIIFFLVVEKFNTFFTNYDLKGRSLRLVISFDMSLFSILKEKYSLSNLHFFKYCKIFVNQKYFFLSNINFVINV